PSYSYRNLIGMALLAAENNRLTAAQIHRWVSSTFPCYIRGVGKWEGGIGAVLSQHKTFIKLPRGPLDDPKQGCYWTFAKD
ncbi:winged helix DNA-binding domain-containing protein, partial [Glonium stellatum]